MTLLERSVASYRTYQEHELDEVRLWCARLCGCLLNELSHGSARLADDKVVRDEEDYGKEDGDAFF